jgi:formylglycine-generating enzyme required for sulfatase activity
MSTPRQTARALSGALFLLTAAAVTLQPQLTADIFGTGANTVTMDFVTIGNLANAPDNTTYGSVPYSYRMGTYEVSRDMIIKANNVGGLAISMSDMSSYGGNGLNRPATGVSWYEAAAFVNWLNVSTGHQAAYNLSGASLSLWPSGDAWQAGGENLYRHKDAYYFLPSENEWYKAAYFDGTTYFNYPTGSDTPPRAVAGGTTARTAVYDQLWEQGPADIANAGGVSPYGTMGQGGNVWEWMESASDGVNNSGSENRGLRGGSWDSAAYYLVSSDRNSGNPSFGHIVIGFRVAAVPEPMEAGGVIGLGALGFALWRGRGSL